MLKATGRYGIYRVCSNRLQFQLHRVMSFTDSIQYKSITNPKDKQIFHEVLIILFTSYLEEYLCCLLTVSVPRRSAQIIKYLKSKCDAKKAALIDKCNLGELLRVARAEISFKKDARKIENIFKEIWDFNPFPNNQTKDIIMDFIRVRNIIVHEGGWPSAVHANQIKSLNVIRPGIAKGFFQLDLADKDEVVKILIHLGYMYSHIEKNLK